MPNILFIAAWKRAAKSAAVACLGRVLANAATAEPGVRVVAGAALGGVPVQRDAVIFVTDQVAEVRVIACGQKILIVVAAAAQAKRILAIAARPVKVLIQPLPVILSPQHIDLRLGLGVGDLVQTILVKQVHYRRQGQMLRAGIA